MPTNSPTAPRLTFDRHAAQEWLESKSSVPGLEECEIGIDEAAELGIDETFGYHSDGFFSYVDELLVQAAEAGVYGNGALAVGVWQVADSEHEIAGCLLTVTLPDHVRLASLHRERKDLLPSREQVHGVDAALEVLQNVTLEINALLDRYEGTRAAK